MDLVFGRSRIHLQLLPIAMVGLFLLSDHMLADLLLGLEDEEARKIAEFSALGLSIVGALLGWNHYPRFWRNWLLLLLATLAVLSLDSWLNYNSFARYPHVTFKILVLFAVVWGYRVFRYRSEPYHMRRIVSLICVGALLNVLLLKRELLGLGAFSDIDRPLDAASAWLLLLSGLYFLNTYLTRGGPLRLGVLLVLFGFLIFLNHRTVWMSSVVALVLNAFLLRRSTEAIRPAAVTSLLLTPTVLGVLGLSLLLSSFPEITQILTERLSDISNVDSQGTGNWRLEQWKAYWPFVLDHPLLGNRFAGFEMPVQFYEESKQAPWADFTGHHFHSLYLDRLFYFGAAGLLMLLPLVVRGVRMVLAAPRLTPQQITWASFVATGLVSGVSYDWPVYFYFLLGAGLSVLEIPAPAPVSPAPVVPMPAGLARPSPRPASLPLPNPMTAANAPVA
jgi:hypothetical protein